MVSCVVIVINRNNVQKKPLEWSFKLRRKQSFVISGKQFLSRTTVNTQTLKIMSVRFGCHLCLPLGTCSILHSSTNNRCYRSCRHIVPCPASQRREKRWNDGGRDTETPTNLLPASSVSPRGQPSDI